MESTPGSPTEPPAHPSSLDISLPDQDDCIDFQEHAEENRNKELLEVIGSIVVNEAKDSRRLTWQALYALKRKEMELN